MLEIFVVACGVIFVYMTVLWLISLVRQDASVVDIFWGPGFVILGSVYFQLTHGYPARKILLLTLVMIWGLRLALYIFWRNRDKGEDKRYQAWRNSNPKKFWWVSYFQVFLLQGGLMLLISIPLLAAQASNEPASFTFLDWSGLGLWIVGFLFEGVGDWQLARFKGDPANKGKVMRAGLWRYTRHPNYFGEAVLWWGYFAFALSANGWWTVYSPMLMTILLLRVSGVALLEKGLAESKPEYRDYVEGTSAFVPWLPRRGE